MRLYQEISFIVLDESGVKLSFSEEGSITNHPPNSRLLIVLIESVIPAFTIGAYDHSTRINRTVIKISS